MYLVYLCKILFVFKESCFCDALTLSIETGKTILYISRVMVERAEIKELNYF